MEKRESIVHFIRENSSLLNQSPFLKRDFKKLKREYFLNIAELGFVPKDKEIAIEAFEILIKTGQISNETDLKKYLEYPFFKKIL